MMNEYTDPILQNTSVLEFTEVYLCQGTKMCFKEGVWWGIVREGHCVGKALSEMHNGGQVLNVFLDK